MLTIRALAKGRIILPAGLRKKFRIEPGTALQIMEYGGIICLIPPVEDPIKAAQESLPSHPSLKKQLLRERKGTRR